jgi:hypothetical protein
MFFSHSTAKSLRERLVEQGLLVSAVSEFQGFGTGGGSHFSPRFAQGVDDLVVSGLRSEIGELILQKDEAKGVFEDAAFGVGGEVLFEIKILHAKNDIIGIAGLAEDFAGFLGMKGLEGGAPLKIARAGHGVGGAGNLPAAEMLAACGQAKFLGSPGAKLEDPAGQFLGEEQFARLRNAAGPLDIRVGCVILVKAGDGRRETIRVADAGAHAGIVGEGGDAATKAFKARL